MRDQGLLCVVFCYYLRTAIFVCEWLVPFALWCDLSLSLLYLPSLLSSACVACIRPVLPNRSLGVVEKKILLTFLGLDPSGFQRGLNRGRCCWVALVNWTKESRAMAKHVARLWYRSSHRITVSADRIGSSHRGVVGGGECGEREKSGVNREAKREARLIQEPLC